MRTKKQKQEYLLKHTIQFFVIFFLVLLSIYTIKTFVYPQTQYTFQDMSQDIILIKIKNNTYTLDTETLFQAQSDAQDSSTHVGFFRGFVMWLGISIGYPPEHILNTAYLTKNIQEWSEKEDIKAPETGYIEFIGTTLQYDKPQSGAKIDEKHLSWKLYTLLRNKEQKRDYTIYPRIKQKQNPIDPTYFNILVDRTNKALQSGITLHNKTLDISHHIDGTNIPTLISFKPNTKTRRFDITINEKLLYNMLQIYETEPINANIIIEDDLYAKVSPSRRGTEINKEKTIANILQIFETPQSSTEMVLTEISPDITTQDLENLEINHLVSSFTTYYSCCESRTQNIQKFSEIVHGTIVKPQETVHLNKLVGRRTPERGFEPAGTIVQGVLVETTGGGVSQFATTLFNALYWGGYTINSHTPHSRYFTRYPEGIEATISWPQPDIVFTNNTNSGMYIHTDARDTFLTVSIFGNNDGRILTGNHRHGNTNITIVEEGSSDARKVSSQVSEREYTGEPRQVYFINPDLPPQTIHTIKHGRPAFKLQVERTVTQHNTQDVWTQDVLYLAEDAEFEIPSCDIVPPEGYCTTQEDQEEKKKQIEKFYQKLEDTF